MSGSLNDVKWAYTLTPFQQLALHSLEAVQDDIAVMPAPVWAQYSPTGEPEGNIAIYIPGAISLAFSDRKDPNLDVSRHLQVYGLEVGQRLRAASIPAPWYITYGYRQHAQGPFGPYRDWYVFTEAAFDTHAEPAIRAVLGGVYEEFDMATGIVPELHGDPVEPTTQAIVAAFTQRFEYYGQFAGHPMARNNLTGAFRPFIGDGTVIDAQE